MGTDFEIIPPTSTSNISNHKSIKLDVERSVLGVGRSIVRCSIVLPHHNHTRRHLAVAILHAHLVQAIGQVKAHLYLLRI